MSQSFSDQLFRKQYPINRSRGLFHNGKTYIVFQGPDSDPRIMVYDHSSELWSQDIQVGENIINNSDDHGNPGMTIDAEGRIHVIYGGHGRVNNGEMRHRVSVNPYDISEWEDGGAIPEKKATYPSLFTLDNGNLIYLYRGNGQHEASWYYTLSNDHGDTWSTPKAFLKGGGSQNDDGWYVYAHAEGNEVHVAFTYRDRSAPRLRYNAYYVKRTAGGDWVDAGGNKFTQPITSAVADSPQNQLRAHAFSGNTMFSTVEVDNTGKPYLSSSMVEDNGIGKYVTNWTGTKWNVQKVASHSGSSRFDTRTALLHRGGDDFSLFSFGNNGRNILEYKTTNGNDSWSAPTTIWNGPADNPTVLWNPSNQAYLFFDDKAPTTFRNGYLYGDSGFVTNTNGGGTGTPQTFEFETLSRSASDPTQVINLSGASNGKFVRLISNSSGDWIEFEVNAAAGTYDLILAGRTAGARGQFQLSIDGVNQGPVIDQYQSSASFKTWNLGQTTFNSSGPHILRFESVGKSPSSGGFTGSFDSIQLISDGSGGGTGGGGTGGGGTGTPQTFEFETLSRSASDSTQIKNLSGASNGKFVRLVSNASGDWIEFDVDAAAGTYDVSLTGRTAGARGQFQLSIDGVNQGPVIEQYQSNASFTDWDLGQTILSNSGTHTFRFEVVGKSPSSGGFTGSFDSLQLTRTDGGASSSRYSASALPLKDTGNSLTASSIEPDLQSQTDDLHSYPNELQTETNAIAAVPQTAAVSPATSFTQTTPTVTTDSLPSSEDNSTTANSVGLSSGNGGSLELYTPDLEVGLYDTQTDNLLQKIQEGDVLLSSLIRNYDVTIAAVVSDDSIVNDAELSMKLNLNEGEVIRKENIEPYALFGDAMGDLRGGSGLSTGENNITFDIYSKPNLKGEFLGTVTRNFTIA